MLKRKDILLLAFVLAIGAWTALPRAADSPKDAPIHVVVHMNVEETQLQNNGLRSISNVLKEAGESTVVEVVCHGPGIVVVEKAHPEHAELVAELIKRGVRFVACENTMRSKSLTKEDLLPGVGTVPSGAAEVIRKQFKDGYAYYKP